MGVLREECDGGENWVFGWCFLVAIMLRQEALWFVQMCATVYLGLCSAFKNERFPSYRQRCCFQKEVYRLHWVQITGCYKSIAQPVPCVFKDVAVIDAVWLISGHSPHGDTSHVLRVIIQLPQQHLYLLSPLPGLCSDLQRQPSCRLFCNKHSLL